MTLYGHIEGGPYFDDLAVGQVFDWAPSMTLTSGAAAVHQSILGDRMRLPLDAELSAGGDGCARPHWRTRRWCATSRSVSRTLVTQRVKANLFYRGLTFHRFPIIGDTLFTRTEVVGLKQNSAKPGRAPTGLAALRMTTIDQADRLVLDFYRCAMLPLRPDAGETGHADDLSADRHRPGTGARPDRRTGTPTRSATGCPGRTSIPDWPARCCTAPPTSSAARPELARLSLNIAATHHDSRVGGQRLVYGGHTIGLALAQASRLLPNLVTVLGWESCDHTGPVHEGDTLYSELHIEAVRCRRPRRVLTLRSLVYAVRRAGPSGAGLAVHRLMF